jgi:hypothetical protein
VQESKEGGRSALYGRKQLKGHDANFVFYYVLESVDPATAQMVVVVRSVFMHLLQATCLCYVSIHASLSSPMQPHHVF